MRKFILIAALVLFSVQSCFAAEIHEETFNGNETLKYPVVHTGDAMIENRINGAIRDEILRFIKEIHYAAQYNGQEAAGIWTNYEIGSNEAGNTIILSVLMTESCYFKGAAHPSTYKRALNFNLSSGDLMSIDYLLEVGEGFKEGYLIERLEKNLRKKIKREKLFLFENALPLKNLPEHFYWDENLHVHFIFQQYEIAPYAVGIIDVDIDE